MSVELRAVAYEYEPVRNKLLKFYHSLKDKLDETCRYIWGKKNRKDYSNFRGGFDYEQ